MPRRQQGKISRHNSTVNRTVLEFQKRFPQGRLWRREPMTAREIHSGNIVRTGQKGMSDLYGYVHAMGLALYLEIEVKTGKATLREHQKVWGEATFKNGGIFLVGREDVEETLKQIEEHIQSVEARFEKR